MGIPDKDFNKIADKMTQAALHAVDPYNLILEQLRFQNMQLTVQNNFVFNLNQYKNIYVIGAGKGTAPMAMAIEELLGTATISEGCISVKYGHGQELEKIKVLEAGHPIPDLNTINNSKRMLKLADNAGKDDLVFVLFTGGGSALFEALPDEISLQDVAEMNQILLSSGAAIDEINTIRKHISLIKGGRLVNRIAPATAISLILSDVIGDPLESIASGPTAPDPSTYENAVKILSKYKIEDQIPVVILNQLKKGINRIVAETPKSRDAVFEKVNNFIIGNNALALKQLQKIAEQNGFNTILLTDQAQGEAREIAHLIAGIVKSCLNHGFPVKSPGCIILGGEPTVTLRGDGKGGRNQEIVLAVMNALSDVNKPFYFCSVGSDGTDGPTDVAGAWIDASSFEKIRSSGLDSAAYLDNNDSYNLFKGTDQLIKTGPTRTNVMDFIFCLI